MCARFSRSRSLGQDQAWVELTTTRWSWKLERWWYIYKWMFDCKPFIFLIVGSSDRVSLLRDNSQQAINILLILKKHRNSFMLHYHFYTRVAFSMNAREMIRREWVRATDTAFIKWCLKHSGLPHVYGVCNAWYSTMGLI